MSAQPKKVAILQSNYIPWKGYFDQIASVDTFVLYDDVQYTRRDWRNRNKVKTGHGVQWLSIPVRVKGQYYQPINEVEVVDGQWCREHWLTLQHAYGKAVCFKETKQFVSEIYQQAESLQRLSEVNYLFISAICRFLGITTEIRWSSDFRLEEGKSERLLSICKQLGASEYVSGPAAQNYLDVSLFKREGLDVTWFEYGGYPEYPQLNPPFDHFVSVLDLIFNVGNDAARYMKYVPFAEQRRTVELSHK